MSIEVCPLPDGGEVWLRVTRRREHVHVVSLTGIVLGTLGRVEAPDAWPEGATVTLTLDREGCPERVPVVVIDGAA